MEEVNLRFQHLSEQIFSCLDNESLINCQEVSRSWNIYLDRQKFLQARIILEIVNRTHKVGKSWFEVFKKCNTKTITDLRVAVEHLYHGIFASYREDIDLSPLHVAAAFGQLTLFNDILHKVENQFPLNDIGWSPLYFAAKFDHLHIYESILAINKNVFPHSTVDLTKTLNTAAFHNSLNVCRYIIKNNSDQISWDNNSSVAIILLSAAFRGHIEIYKMIMAKVADKNPATDGSTPLHFAAGMGCFEMCKLILENVNDKNPVDNNGKTPKDMTEAANHNEIVKLFP